MNDLDSSPVNTDVNTGKLHILEMPRPVNPDPKSPTDILHNIPTAPHDTPNAPYGTSNAPHVKPHNLYHSSPRCLASFPPYTDVYFYPYSPTSVDPPPPTNRKH